MKDYIEIVTDEIGKEKMEAVMILELEEFSFKYIIYRTLDKKHYYVSKFTGENLVDLNTDISDKELRICNKLFEGVIKNAIRS